MQLIQGVGASCPSTHGTKGWDRTCASLFQDCVSCDVTGDVLTILLHMLMLLFADDGPVCARPVPRQYGGPRDGAQRRHGAQDG
jgi:hypothetical protein